MHHPNSANYQLNGRNVGNDSQYETTSRLILASVLSADGTARHLPNVVSPALYSQLPAAADTSYKTIINHKNRGTII